MADPTSTGQLKKQRHRVARDVHRRTNRKKSQPKSRRRIFALISISMGTLVALLIAELGLRVYVARRGWTPNCYVTGLAFFVPHDQAGHTLRPHLKLRSSSYDVSTNSLGLRGSEVLIEKPADTVRVMVLGGSSVFGYLVPEGQDSCVDLEEILSSGSFWEGLVRGGSPLPQQDGWRTRRVEVLNAGVPGYNMTQCRMRYVSDLVKLQPDWVILYLGWNDSPTLISSDPDRINRTPPAPVWWRRVLIHSVVYGLISHRLFPSDAPQFAPPKDASTHVTEAGSNRFRQDYQALIDAVQESGANILVSTQLMAGVEDCAKLDRFLGSSPEQVQTNRTISQAITRAVRDLAHDNGLPLADVGEKVPCDDDSLGDAIHLTRRGHRLVAEVWAAELAEEMAEEMLRVQLPSQPRQ